jgi:DDE superfamily endonuclease
MFSVAKLKRKPQHFRSFTGMTGAEFEVILKAIVVIYEEVRNERLGRESRQRQGGAGRKFELGIAERLLLTLMATRLSIENTLLGYLFNLDATSVGREINHRMRPALLRVLPLPAQDDPGLMLSGQGKPKKIRTLAELLEKHPEFKEILLDASEQEVPKPKEKLARKQRYSGKQKKHTLKFQITTTRKVILHLSRHVPGAVHDHTLLRASGVVHRLGQRLLRVDKGYDNLEAEYPHANIHKPKKARPNHPLDLVEKLVNQVLSSLRMPVEHHLQKMKTFKILSGVYRGKTHFYDDITLLVAGLCNFKSLGSLAW